MFNLATQNIVIRISFLFTFLSFNIITSNAQWRKTEKTFEDFVATNELPQMQRGKHVSLKNEKIEKARAKCWQEWKKANKKNLFASPDSVVHKLLLPSVLEPNALLNYRLFYTDNTPSCRLTKHRYTTTPDHKLPLFVYLHGSGPREQEFSIGYKLAQRFHIGKSIYFIPQIPQEGEWYRWYQKSKQWMLEHLLRETMLRDDIDPRRLYLFGISEGGYGSQRLASFYADYWAAVGPMAGGEPLKNAPIENLRHTPFSLRTGSKDYGFYRNMLTLATKRALDSIACKNTGAYRHWISLEKGRGHHINYAPTPEWLSLWQRSGFHDKTSWEDFEMDGRHRKGFQNIEVLKRPSELRTRYELSIENNVVRLRVEDIHYTTTLTDPHWHIPLLFKREYVNSKNGKVRIFLHEKQVDLQQPITVYVNGKLYCKKRVKANTGAMAHSLMLFSDPLRIFPAYVDIKY